MAESLGKSSPDPVEIPTNYTQLRGSERRPSPGAKHLGAADANEEVRVTIALRRRLDGSPIPSFDYFAKTPPVLRPRLSEEEFAAKYGADPKEMDQVVGFAQAHGLNIVQTHAGRRTAIVSGTVAQMSEAFAVTLGRYEHSIVRGRGEEARTETYRGRDGFIYVPSALAEVIVGVFGLDNRRITKRNGADPSPIGPLTVSQVSRLYNFPTNSATGQTIAIFSETGYLLSDLETYFAPLAPPLLPDISVDASNAGVADGETTQDICISASAAPGAMIQVYFTTFGQAGWFDLIHRVVHPEAGDPTCSVLSSSFYVSNGDNMVALIAAGVTVSFITAVTLAFQDAAIQGVTICVASGDTGAQSKTTDGMAQVQYPASDPWVLSCGGTSIGDLAGSSFAEYVWNDGGGATGGGVSNYFPLPSYQEGAHVPVSLNGGGVGRGVPDLAANASPSSGYPITVGGAAGTGDGTSASAPLLAGLIAVINAAIGAPVGFINPALYASGTAVTNPVPNPPGQGPLNNTYFLVTGYPVQAGWDACTGWGSPNGKALLAALQQGTQKDCYFILDWSTFSKAGMDEMLAASGGSPVDFEPAFYIVADWFTPADLNVGGATPVEPVLTISPPLAAAAIALVAGPTTNGVPINPAAPQRFTYTYKLTFTGDSDFPPSGQESKPITIQASITGAVSGITVSSSAVLELTNQSAPFMLAGPVTWLSNDVRVFQIEPGASPTWLQNLNLLGEGPGTFFIVQLVDTANPTHDATSFIQQVIQAFNVVASTALPPAHPFDSIPTGESASQLDTLQTDPSTSNPVYNFAVARVRYQDLEIDAQNVRVFFRTFPAAAISTAYDQTTTYRRWSDGVEFGDTISLFGSQFDASLGEQLETVPFFANPRVNATVVSMDSQLDAENVQTLLHDSSDAVTYAYYGCWLDINQPELTPYPQVPVGDGPYTGPTVPVLSLLANQHQCLTAELAFDPIPIAAGSTPGSSQMLGQRNLTLAPVANPGQSASRMFATTFEMNSTRVNLPNGEKPAELMIDWGTLPPGSVATLYVPAADAEQMSLRARELYGQSIFTIVDRHTLQFRAENITYIPIPANANANLAALISVELPIGIRKGQAFNGLVRQVNSFDAGRGEQQKATFAWRRVLGSFQISIPVLEKAQMLQPEERLLSQLRWIRKGMPAESRWHPVFARYVEQIAARVQALGGNPAAILPSPTGDPSGSKPPDCLEFTGKVAGITYGIFGNFDGFLLGTEEGRELSFDCREEEIKKLIDRAWSEHITISVIVAASHPHRPTSVIYRT